MQKKMMIDGSEVNHSSDAAPNTNGKVNQNLHAPKTHQKSNRYDDELINCRLLFTYYRGNGYISAVTGATVIIVTLTGQRLYF